MSNRTDTGEQMPQEQFQRVKQMQNPSAGSSEGDRDSTVTACPGNNAWKRPSESKELCQAVVRIVNEAASDEEEGSGDVGEAERRRSERDQQSKINLARGKQPDRDSVEQHPSVQDPDAQARQKQKRTRDQQACLRRYQQRPRRPKKRMTSANPKLSW